MGIGGSEFFLESEGAELFADNGTLAGVLLFLRSTTNVKPPPPSSEDEEDTELMDAAEELVRVGRDPLLRKCAGVKALIFIGVVFVIFVISGTLDSGCISLDVLKRCW